MAATAHERARTAAIDAGEALLLVLREHIDRVAAATGDDPDAEEIDQRLWDAVAAYGDALDERFGEEDDEPGEPVELTFTVRARYDYTVVDEKKFLAAGAGVGAAVAALLAGGRVIPALEVASLERGSGLVTVHLDDEPLVPADFEDAADVTDLLLVDPAERLAQVITEPMYESRAEAEAAAKREV
ncbi:hypothetical protein BH09ACT3_BH09ACT3_04350 [soil metagenome]